MNSQWWLLFLLFTEFFCMKYKATFLEAVGRDRNCLYLICIPAFCYLIYLQMLYFDWLNCWIKKNVLNIG